MIEVFKTNVSDLEVARAIVEMIHTTFEGCAANFDLQDCDRILRVESRMHDIEPELIIALLNDYGHHAEVLDDMLLASTN